MGLSDVISWAAGTDLLPDAPASPPTQKTTGHATLAALSRSELCASPAVAKNFATPGGGRGHRHAGEVSVHSAEYEDLQLAVEAALLATNHTPNTAKDKQAQLEASVQPGGQASFRAFTPQAAAAQRSPATAEARERKQQMQQMLDAGIISPSEYTKMVGGLRAEAALTPAKHVRAPVTVEESAVSPVFSVETGMTDAELAELATERAAAPGAENKAAPVFGGSPATAMVEAIETALSTAAPQQLLQEQLNEAAVSHVAALGGNMTASTTMNDSSFTHELKNNFLAGIHSDASDASSFASMSDASDLASPAATDSPSREAFDAARKALHKSLSPRSSEIREPALPATPVAQKQQKEAVKKSPASVKAGSIRSTYYKWDAETRECMFERMELDELQQLALELRLTKDLKSWEHAESREMIVEQLVAHIEQTKAEEEEEERAFAEFAAKASPAPSLAAEGVGSTPAAADSPVGAFDLGRGDFMAPSPAMLARRGAGFSPVQSDAAQLAKDAGQARLFAFATHHGAVAPDLKAMQPARTELSLDMSAIATQMGGMQLTSPAVSTPLSLDPEEEAQLNELSELDDMLRETDEMEDVNEILDEAVMRPDGRLDGFAVELEALSAEEEVVMAKEARAADLRTFAVAPPPIASPMVEAPTVDADAAGSGYKPGAMAFEDAYLLETPYLRTRPFSEPDVQTPGGTFLFASPGRPAFRDVTNTHDDAANIGTPVPSIGRPFTVDFEANFQTSSPGVWDTKETKRAAARDDVFYLQEVCAHLKMNLKAGVPELGSVIRALKVAKPLQVEPCIAPLYIALRRHAAALHAARRAGVCIRAHKPAPGQLGYLSKVAARNQAVESPRRSVA